MSDLFQNNGAEFSDDRKYRYALWRIWDETKPLVMFIGLNPSTAKEDKNDPTITKLKKITANNGYGGFYMMNLFPIVSADPKVLLNRSDEDFKQEVKNVEWLYMISNKVQIVVFAWGNFKEAYSKSKTVIEFFSPAMCLKINKNGSPKHPLYCKDDPINSIHNLT